MIGRRSAACTVFLCALLLASCGQQKAGVPTGSAGPAKAGAPAGGDNGAAPAASAADCVVVAVVNGENVTGRQLELFATDRVPSFKGASRAEWNEAVDTLINNRLLARKAERAKVDAIPAVSSRLQIACSAVWEDIYWMEVVRSAAALTEKDYEKAAPRFVSLVTVRQMVVSDAEKARELRRQAVANPAGFEKLVREASEGLTAAKGGLVPNVTKDSPQYSDEIKKVLFSTRQGDFTQVIESPIGPTFFQIVRTMSPEDSKKDWRRANADRLLQEKARTVWEKHMDGLIRKHKVKYFTENIKAYGDAVEKKKDLSAFSNKPAARVDNVVFTFGTIADPSGIGVVHSNDTMDLIARKRISRFLLSQDLEERGLKAKHPEAMDRERFIREAILARAYIDHRAATISVGDADLVQYYNEHKAKYTRGRVGQISAIETKSPDRLKTIYGMLAAGEPFEKVAEQWSDNKRYAGGRVGEFEIEGLKAPFDAVKALKPGEYTKKPIELIPEGNAAKIYVVMRLDRVREPETVPFEKIRKQDLRAAVLAWRREALVKTVQGELRSENKVVVPEGYNAFVERKVTSQKNAGGKHG